MSNRYELHQNWTLSFTHPATRQPVSMEATVPGNVEIDLQREGLIVDPYPPDTPNALRAFEPVNDWVYETTFEAVPVEAGQKTSLVLEGIDTIADVVLNGEKILRCENMFIPHAVDVTGKLKDKGNVLRVHIFNPELHARKFKHTPFQVSREHRQAQAYLRKARHMWGWDNAPRLISAGLWRPVVLLVENETRFVDVYAYTQRVEGDSASLGVSWTIETPDIDLSSYIGKMTLSFDGKTELEQDFDIEFIAGRFLFSLPSPRLWWPRGYGDANLHDLKLVLLRGGQPVAEWSSKFGIREVELIRTETTNEKGEGEFVFKCNGEKIYINGTNWKPLDALHSLAASKMENALDLCLDLNCNMVRIWGGGVYETHDFFDYCDRTGLLVWQDFMFGCEFPPRDEFFLQQVAHEAEVIVKQLRNHPSLALWCGDNENDMTVFWGLYVPPRLLPSDNETTRKVLKRAVLENDPYRSYLESSPYISDELAKDRWSDGMEAGFKRMLFQAPEQHIYAPGGDFYALYRKSAAHFVSETGPFFVNSMSTTQRIVEREMPRARRLWDFDTTKPWKYTEYHQWDGYFLAWKDTAQKHLRALFNREFSIEDWNELAFGINVVTGNIFKFAIEYFRVRKWRKTGVIWWSLLDMWPMMFNYSVVDSDFRKKQPAYGWIRQSQQASCLIAEESEDGDSISLFAVNDTRQKWQGGYRIVSLAAGEGEKELLSSELVMEPNATTLLKKLPNPKLQTLWVLEWTIDGKTSFNHFVCGKPPYSFEVYREWCRHMERLAA